MAAGIGLCAYPVFTGGGGSGSKRRVDDYFPGFPFTGAAMHPVRNRAIQKVLAKAMGEIRNRRIAFGAPETGACVVLPLGEVRSGQRSPQCGIATPRQIKPPLQQPQTLTRNGAIVGLIQVSESCPLAALFKASGDTLSGGAWAA